MAIYLLLIPSIILEALASVWALRLTRLAGRNVAWYMISSAFALRAITLIQHLGLVMDQVTEVSLAKEATSFAVSALTVVGVLLISPIFRKLDEADQKREEYLSQVRQQAKIAEQGEKILDALMESIPEGITIADKNLHVLRTSRFSQKLVGAPPEQLNHSRFGQHSENFRLCHPSTGLPVPDDELPLMRSIREEIVIEAEEWSIHRPDGQLLTVLANASPIRNAEGEIIGGVVAWRDISEQKRLTQEIEKRAAQLEASFHSIADGVIIYDLQGNILNINPAAMEILGYSAEDTKKPYSERISRLSLRTPGGDPFPLERFPVSRAFEGETAVGIPLVFAPLGKNPRWVMLSAAPIRGADNQMIGVVCTFTDFTLQIEAKNTAEQRLAQLQGVFSSLVEGLLFASPNGTLVQWNPAAAHMHGFAFPEEVPTEISELSKIFEAHSLDGTPLELDQWPLLKTIRGEEFTNQDCVVRRIDTGMTKILRYNGTSLRGKDGSVTLGILAAHDVTDAINAAKALRKSEEQFRAFFENAAVGTVQIDLKGNILRTNERFCEIVGYSQAELQKISFPDLLCRDQDRIDEYHRFMRGEKSFQNRDEQLCRKDGTEIWVSLSAALVRDTDGTPLLAVGVAQDITGRKIMEADLRLALKTAEEANRAKSDFLAIISHELRTPMTVILGALEYLRQDQESEAMRNELLEMADSSAQRLLGIIDDLLDLSKIEAKRLKIEEQAFSLRKSIHKVVKMFAATAQEKGLELRQSIDPQLPDLLRGDPNRLDQVLVNLVGNALKFTDRGEVAVGVARVGKNLCFSIRDTGIGIPKEKIGDLFQPFTQVDTSMTRPYGGTGLGLAISKELVEMMGGSIEVESEIGQGSHFFFTIPFMPDEHGRVPNLAEPEKNHPKSLKILVVEDDPVLRDLLGMILDRTEFSVVFAKNGREAMRLCQRKEKGFDLILMDLQMPEMNGIEATKQIREMEEGQSRRTCIIALTAHVRPEDQQECLSAGMDGILAKPFHIEDLNRVLENCPS